MNKLLLSLLFLLSTSLAFSQLFEGFENTSGISGSLPATWALSSGNWAVFEKNTQTNVGTTQSWGINAFSTGIFNEGIQCASVSREQIGAGNTSEDYLATPSVYIPTSGTIELHFQSRLFTLGNQGTIYRIMIAPAIAGLQTDPSAYTVLTQWTEDQINTSYNVFEEKTVDLSAFAGLNVYIAFVRIYTQPDGNINGDRWMIDEVNLQGNDPCSLTAYANYSSPGTVELSWISPNPVEVMILPCDAPAPAPTDNGIAVTANSYQFTNLIPDACYMAFIKTTCPVPNSWHRVNLNHQYAPIHLVAYIDTNNNGIRDTGETNFHNGYFTLTRNNLPNINYIGSYNGLYTFIPNNINDTYDFGYQIDSFYSSCISLGNFNFNDIQVSAQTAQILYFPLIQTNNNCFDNRIVLYSYNHPRAGLIDRDNLRIESHGQNPADSGTLTYTKAANITISSVNPSAGIVFTPTGFTYNYSGLATHSLNFDIYNSIPPIPTVNLGDLLTSSAAISFSPADANASNDTSVLTQTILASYDPNDITESHGPQIQFDQFSQNDYLYYTIRFQNTGNANAIKVLVNNILDSRIDETSISMIAARHNYTMVRNGSNISWEFNNIQLPPASVNEDLSNGFINFRVKLKPGFAIGDIIPATASIYFDSNPAIVTDTFNTQFVQTMGVPTFNADTVSLSPNPATTTVTITNSGIDKISKVTVYDVSGKKIYTLNNNALDIVAIDASQFAKGMYLIELTSGNNLKITKKLIIK
jgi:uncharacterized repeat protein (TIGR01451 family)